MRSGEKWLLHAGDSYFFHGQIETPVVRAPLMLGAFQRMADTDRAARVANQERVRRLKAPYGSEINIFNRHDPIDDARCCDRR